jgi:hypothetical protein
MTPPANDGWRRLLFTRWGSNLLLVVGAYVVYTLLRYSLLQDSSSRAFGNADGVIRLERMLGIYREAEIQQWALEYAEGVVRFFNWFYTLGFFPVILPVAVLVFLAWPRTFSYYRDIFLISMVLTWIISGLFPLAPPRFLPEQGFVDAIALLGPDLYSSRESMSFYNAYSAMPSMHVGWPVLYGVMWFQTGRRWLQVLALVYPAMLFAAVTVAGNHFFLDGLVGVLVIVASFWLRHGLIPRAGSLVRPKAKGANSWGG